MECLICNSSAEELARTGPSKNILCPLCGQYGIADQVDIEALRELDLEQRGSVLDRAKRQQGNRPIPMITSHALEKRTFAGSTRSEANRKADDFLAQHKVRLIHRNQTGAGFGRDLNDVDQWTVNIYYESESSD